MMRTRHLADIALSAAPEDESGREILSEGQFRKMLSIERRRSERSQRRFVLMLLESEALLKEGEESGVVERTIQALATSTRETDIKGWYQAEAVIGVIFTEIGSAEGRSVANALLGKVTQALSSNLGIEQIRKIALSFYVFPEEANGQGNAGRPDACLAEAREPGVAKSMKRALDIAGSAALLLLLAPLMVVAALAVKLSSPGPVLFRQARVGRRGRLFTLLKFRSMHHGNDAGIHERFVRSFIQGAGGSDGAPCKLTADPRITRLGRFLRKTSLDEIPQLLNVLAGDMSLVGPRPPLPYEFECYRAWHRRRVMDVKPGITGLWQVAGRSRVGFDDMVRLDLRYIRSWSLWLDLRILLETPRAVLSGDGAY